MKLARIGFGRSCGDAEHKPFPSIQPLNTSAAASSYVVCDVVELHETLQGSRDDGAVKKGRQVESSDARNVFQRSQQGEMII